MNRLAIASISLLFSTLAHAQDPDFLKFPQGFKWCVATAAHQVEGNNTESDWWDFEQLPAKIKNGDKSGLACDHWNRVDQDVALMRELNLIQYRFSVEWAKIEPQQGIWNQEALVHYRNEIKTLIANGIEPMVTLHHFTLPRWFREKGGWSWEGAPEAFGVFAEKVVSELGEGTRDWITFNEPTGNIVAGYLEGLHPPGLKVPFDQLVPPLLGILRAHANAYARMKKHGPIRIGFAHHLRILDPSCEINPLDIYVAHALDQLFNWATGEALESGSLKLYFPFMLNVDEKIEGLAGTQDFVGVNYYSRDRIKVTLQPPRYMELAKNPDSSTDPRYTDLGWEIYPRGFYRILKEVVRRFPNKPILITENGIADRTDQARVHFLEEHLYYLHKAIQEGAPIEGYCHWSLMDNFEWAEGFSARFGLYETDYVTQARTPRASAMLFSRIAKDNGFLSTRH